MFVKYCKIITFLILSVTVVLAFSIGVTAADAIEISWFSENHHEPQIKPLRDRLVKEFEELHPNVKILLVQPPVEKEWMKFSVMAGSGITPDIIDLSCDYIGSAIGNEWVLCLDEFVTDKDKDGVSKSALAGATVDGKLYGWPFMGAVFGNYYNKKLVIEAGLDPNNPPQTWDEFLDWVLKLNNPPNVYGYAGIWDSGTAFRHHMAYLLANGTTLLDDNNTECLLDQPAAIETLRFWTELFTKYNAMPPGPTTYTYNEETRAFALGLAASMTNAYWGMPKVIGDNPEMEDNFIIGPIPYTKEPATYFQVIYQVIGAHSKNPEMAFEFIKFLTTKEHVTERALMAKWMHFRTDALNEPQLQQDKYLGTFLKFMENAYTNPTIQTIAEIQQRVITMLQDVLIGKRSVEEASIEAKKDIDKILMK